MAGRIAGITIEIGGDTKKLTSALKGVDKDIRSTQTALKDVNKLLKLDPKSTELLTQKEKLLKEAIEQTKDRLATLQEAAKNNDLGAKEHDALQREIIETEQKLESLQAELDSFGSVGKQKMKALGEEISSIGDKIKAVGDKITSVGESMTKKVTAPITAVGAAAVKSFKDVDEGYDTIIAKTGATGKNLDGLKDTFDTIFSSMNVSSKEAGDAIGELNTRFGMTGDTLTKNSKKFLEYSKLNNTDVVSSIDNVQNAMAAFGMKSSEAGNLLDVLNKVGQDTGANVGKLESVLVSNATALQEMGMDAYQSATFLGKLETAGADSESVISGMKRALKSATDQGIPFKDALKNLESTIKNGTGSMDGLSAAYDLFGKSGAGVYEAVKNGQISFTDLADSADVLEGALGSVDGTFSQTQDGSDKFAAAMNQAKLTLASLGSSIQASLAPMIEKASQALAKMKEKFDSLSPAQKDMIVKIGLVAAALGPALVIIGSVISAVGTIGSAIGAVVGVLNPVGLAIAAVVAVGALLIANWDKIKDAAKKLASKVKEKFSDLKSSVTKSLEGVKKAASEKMEAAKKAIDNKLGNIKKAYEDHGGGIKGIASASMEAVKSYYSLGFSFIDNLTGGKLSSIKDTMSKKMSEASENVSKRLEDVKKSFSDKMESAKSTVDTKLANIKGAYQSHGGGIAGITAAALETVKSYYSVGFSAIDSLTGGKLSSIRDTISSKMSDAASTVSSKLASIKSAFSEKLGAARDKVSEIIQSIKQKFNFSWSLPHLKLPHLTITGKFGINPPSVPKFSISWYAKAMDNAMVLANPTLFGMAGGKMLGAGEAGREVISGESHLISLIGDSVGAQMAPIYNLMERYFPEFAGRTVAIPERTLERGLRRMGVVFE